MQPYVLSEVQNKIPNIACLSLCMKRKYLSKKAKKTNQSRAWARFSKASYALPRRKHIAEEICHKKVYHIFVFKIF